MKPLVIFVFLSLQGLTMFSQCIGLSVGYCNNHFFDFQKVDSHFRSNYEDGTGYSINFNIDDLLLNRIRLRLALNFNKNIAFKK